MKTGAWTNKAAAIAAATLTYAAATTTMAIADQTVRIGMVNSLTGPHSGFDLPASEGTLMAFHEINKKGGITVNGEKVTFEIVSEDAQSKPDVAVNAAQKILQNDDIRIVYGIMTSGPGMAAATLFSRSEVLYIGGFTLLDTLLGKPGGELMIRTLNSDAAVAQSFVPQSVKVLGVKKIGIILPNEDVSRSIVETYKPLLEKAGVEVPIVEYFQPSTTDFAPVLRKFQNQGLDGLFVGTNDAVVEAIVRQTTELGGLPKKFMYRGGSGAPGLKYKDQIEGFVWQILTRDLEFGDDPKVQEWKKAYTAFTGKEISPNTYWGLVYYDTVFMMAKAMEQVGSTDDVEAIAKAMKSMTYEGVRTMRFSEEGRARSDIDIGTLLNGKISSVRASAE
ncbi:hypothetical protein CSC94_23510 [Zhengella mangrovi]|uniref:Leucine-binding protein domain-containing protein n=1 Tax=Zhengella mangrovi TaxID=1982044 RepID=A0A2G1QGE7_9HYPH|nr:ABC transporter substrate-binding protein [Zhengella mangrovi]PHP64596.1 hypothetical protein CSC94_23510 [Zhengella mangrovi]